MIKESEISYEEIEELVIKYFQMKQKFENNSEKFDAAKKRFYEVMESYLHSKNIEELKLDLDEFENSCIKVKRIQNISIKFNEDLLEKALSKDLANQVIKKQYAITNIEALIRYLKDCNVDPKVFKTFITTTKSVNIKELERLESIGKIDKDQIKGCYTVKANAPYFKVTKGKGDSD